MHVLPRSGIAVLYQSSEILVLDKPAGVSLFADRNSEGDLFTLIRDELTELLPGSTVRHVHRLDKGTSGALVVALSRSVQKHLNQAFAAQQVRKNYVALTCGHIPATQRSGYIDLPLKPGRKSRYRIAAPREAIERDPATGFYSAAPQKHIAGGHAAQTRFRLLGHFTEQHNHYSWVSLAPKTGRTHQLRVHLSWIGFPIRGDHLYGAPERDAQQWARLALHAHRLGLPTRKGNYISVTAPLPEEMRPRVKS